MLRGAPHGRTRLLRSALRRFHGVACSPGGAIVGLRLGFNALQGTLPSSLGSLEALTTLDVQYNFLSGSLPATLASIGSLSELRISYNLFTLLPPTLSWLPAISMDHMLLSPDAAAGFGASALCSPAVCASRYAYICPPFVPPGIDNSDAICPNCNVSCFPAETMQSFLMGVIGRSDIDDDGSVADSTASALRVGLASGPRASPIFVARLAAATAFPMLPPSGPVFIQGAGLGAGLSLCSVAICTVAIASSVDARNKMRVACKMAPRGESAVSNLQTVDSAVTGHTEPPRRVRLSWIPLEADSSPVRGQQPHRVTKETQHVIFMTQPGELSSRPAPPASSKSFARSRSTGRVSGLLNTLLPRYVSERILQGEDACPEEFVDVTIMFCDICGFTVCQVSTRNHRTTSDVRLPRFALAHRKFPPP